MNSLDIKFIAVEVFKKGACDAKFIEYGLFKGIKTRSDGDESKAELVSFILIEKPEEKDSIQAFNLNDFNVLSISSRCGDIKELIVYKKHDEDQTKASKLLHDFINDLRKDKRMVRNDPEIIDVNTYTNLPGVLKSMATKQHKETSILHKATHHQQNSTVNDYQKKRKEKEEEEARQEALRKIPTVFKRKDKAPGVKSLNLMRKKISLIAAGDYESEIEKGEEGSLKKVTTNFLSG